MIPFFLIACGTPDPDAGVDVRVRIGHEVTINDEKIPCTKTDCKALPDRVFPGDASLVVRLDSTVTWGEVAPALQALSWARPAVPLAVGDDVARAWAIPGISFSREGLVPRSPGIPTARVTVWARPEGVFRRVDAIAAFGTPSWRTCDSLGTPDEIAACGSATADAPGQVPLSPWGQCFAPTLPAAQLRGWAGFLTPRLASYQAQEWGLVVHPRVEASAVVAILEAWAAAGLPEVTVGMSEDEPPDIGDCHAGPVDGHALALATARFLGARASQKVPPERSTDIEAFFRILGGMGVDPPAEQR